MPQTHDPHWYPGKQRHARRAQLLQAMNPRLAARPAAPRGDCVDYWTEWQKSWSPSSGYYFQAIECCLHADGSVSCTEMGLTAPGEVEPDQPPEPMKLGPRFRSPAPPPGPTIMTLSQALAMEGLTEPLPEGLDLRREPGGTGRMMICCRWSTDCCIVGGGGCKGFIRRCLRALKDRPKRGQARPGVSTYLTRRG